MLQEIDDLLSGGLTDEDEEAVLAELDAITKGDETVELPSVPDEELPEIGKITHNKKAKVGKITCNSILLSHMEGSYCASGFLQFYKFLSCVCRPQGVLWFGCDGGVRPEP